jgi:hypothetical protein
MPNSETNGDSKGDANNDELHWRETYFVLFSQDRRPTLKQVATALTEANRRFQLENPESDDGGLLESLLVESSEDHAAVEISYEVGDAVVEQNLEWAKQLQNQLPVDQLQELIRADARLDVAHFERVPSGGSDDPDAASPLGGGFGDPFGDDEDEPFEMLDPTCLLTVVDTLASLTDGLTFDPASGEILT